MHRAHVRPFLIGFGILALAGVASAQSRTRTILSGGDTAPGGGTFQLTTDSLIAKGLPSIAGNTIVVGADIALNGQTVYGVYSETNGVLRLITRIGSPAPNGGTIKEILHFAPDRYGSVYLLARVGDGPGADSVLKYSFPLFTVLAHVGDALPNGKTITSLGAAVAPDGRGGVFFTASTGAQGSFDGAVVHVKSDFLNPKEIVAETGMLAPGGGTFSSFSSATIASSTSGLVAFAATTNGGPSGLFAGLAGNLVLAADASDALPDITVADNDDAEVSYIQPSQPGIKTATLTGVTTFVPNGTAAPRSTGTMSFAQFAVALAADREGSLYFFAPISGDPKRGAGLFRRDRFTNAVTSIALQGDPAAGDVGGVYGIFALATARPVRIANDDGRVVFAASAGSQSNNIAVFTTLGAPDGLTPSVTGVSVKGGKLVVTGASFENGARILVNSNPLADTKNNKKSPTSKLTSKAGGTSVAPGATVSISVRNPTGAVSAAVSFTRPR